MNRSSTQLPLRQTHRAAGSQARPVCRFFVQGGSGGCLRGDACPFRHDAEALPKTAPWNSGTSKTSSVTASRPKYPCRFFAQGTGYCRNGEGCPFSHDSVVLDQGRVKPAEILETSPTSEDSRARVPCSFYLKGSCRNGDACPYAHTSERDTGESSADHFTSSGKEENMPVDDWVRYIYGALVLFGDGGAVLKTSLPSDFSAVRLSMLPPESSPDSVVRLLHRMGVLVAPEGIRMLPQKDQAGCVADVTVEDPTFAKHLSAAVDSHLRPIDETGPPGFKVEQISVPNLWGGSNSHRVECKKIHCSWHLPLKTVWLNFREHYAAEKIANKFAAVNGYKVLGQAVKSSRPTRSGGYFNPLAWTVTLTEVPGRASQADILQSMPRTIRPEHVELGDAYTCDLATSTTLVKSKVAEIGLLDWWEGAVSSPGGKRAKATARFRNEGDAEKAAGLLDGSVLPFNKSGRLTVKAVYSARFKVSDRIYMAVEGAVATQIPIWSAKHATFTAYDPSRGYRVLRLEGEDKAVVFEAKKGLDKILSGELVMANGEILWTPAFEVNGDVYHRIKAIETMLGVVVMRDRRRSRLYLYGQPQKCSQAQALLVDVSKQDVSTARVIYLDEKTFSWACRGGFKELVKVLGEKVVFDIISEPKRILVTGSGTDLKLAQDMITGRKECLEGEDEVAATADCAICWTEAENPIQTLCKHTYCSDCFERFCFANTSHGSDFCLKCEGDSGNCKTILALDELQTHLSSNTFDDVLKASFKSHVRRRPEIFQYCPTADCDQIYRTSSTAPGVVFTCPECLTAVCTHCHVSHTGMTCGDHKYLVSDGYAAFEKTKKKLGIKDCPKCKTSLEKIDGCDHMTCGGCQTHICWKCLATFATRGECYTHMNRVHGSIGIDLPE